MAPEISTKPETRPDERLTGDKVQRIVDAMRTCVAQRGIAGATFEHVSREAGVSRGLLHYYFGTKERLLIEVLRSDAETRIGALDQPLEAAKTADDVLDVLVAGAEEILQSDPGFYVLLYELFTAGRQNPEIRAELAQVYEGSRRHVAEILRRKEAEGVLSLRFDAETVRDLHVRAPPTARRCSASPTPAATTPSYSSSSAASSGTCWSRTSAGPTGRYGFRTPLLLAVLPTEPTRVALRRWTSGLGPAGEDPLHPPQRAQRAAGPQLAAQHRPPRVAAADRHVDPVAPRRLEREVGVGSLALDRLGVPVVDPHVPGRGVLEAPLDRQSACR